MPLERGQKPDNSTNPIRVKGMVCNRQIHMLIAMGNSHNFLELTVAKTLACKITTTKLMYVDVASSHIPLRVQTVVKM